MHYTKLVEGHKAFYTGESRAKNYDGYMIERKNWKVWQTPVVSKTEIEKLFHFIRSWDRFFRGDPFIFQSIYQKIYPVLEELRNERTEDADFSNASFKEKVQNVFDWAANCTAIERYESTDASKILQTILPNFFVMWDDKIKTWTVGGGRNGRTYSYEFLPKMQEELNEAIESCMTKMKLDRKTAIKYIREHCGYETLAKLADEHNYVKYTLQNRAF